jgi:hypothetical protein
MKIILKIPLNSKLEKQSMQYLKSTTNVKEFVPKYFCIPKKNNRLLFFNVSS